MRAIALMGLLILPASAATAAPSGFPGGQLVLPSQEMFAVPFALARAKADATLPEDIGLHTHYLSSERGFSVGPLRVDGTDTAGFGRRRGLKPRYRLEGVSVLGGSIGGSIDGRGAMFSLHWGDSH